jgi:hypothetical protein
MPLQCFRIKQHFNIDIIITYLRSVRGRLRGKVRKRKRERERVGDFLIIVCVFAEVTKCWLFQPAHGAPCANGGGGYNDEGKREVRARAHTHTHTRCLIL